MLGKDMYIALVVLVLSIVGVHLSYPKLVIQERPETPLSEIKLGSFSYALMVEDQCIGSFKRRLELDDQIEFDWQGDIGVSYNGQASRYVIDGFGGFNSLGQLVGVAVTIKGGETNLTIGLEEVNPIRLTFRGRIGKRQFDFSRYVPGPIELFQDESSSIRIQYRDSGLFAHWGPYLYQQPLMESLDLHLLEMNAEQERQCRSPESTLMLDPYLETLKPLLSVLS